jgi:hypothetical protein
MVEKRKGSLIAALTGMDSSYVLLREPNSKIGILTSCILTFWTGIRYSACLAEEFNRGLTVGTRLPASSIDERG